MCLSCQPAFVVNGQQAGWWVDHPDTREVGHLGEGCQGVVPWGGSNHQQVQTAQSQLPPLGEAMHQGPGHETRRHGVVESVHSGVQGPIGKDLPIPRLDETHLMPLPKGGNGQCNGGPRGVHDAGPTDGKTDSHGAVFNAEARVGIG